MAATHTMDWLSRFDVLVPDAPQQLFDLFSNAFVPDFPKIRTVTIPITRYEALDKTVEQSLLNTGGMGGIPEELERRTLAWRMDEAQLASDAEQHFNVPGRRLGSDYFMDSQTVTYEISKMIQESGVEMLLSTYVVDGTGRWGCCWVVRQTERRAERT